MANLTGGHLFIRCLKQEGIQKIFTIVGDTILPLVDAAADEGIEFIDTRHEGAAMHMPTPTPESPVNPQWPCSPADRVTPTLSPVFRPSSHRKVR